MINDDEYSIQLMTIQPNLGQQVAIRSNEKDE